jgi:hypothetical protein
VIRKNKKFRLKMNKEIEFVWCYLEEEEGSLEEEAIVDYQFVMLQKLEEEEILIVTGGSRRGKLLLLKL